MVEESQPIPELGHDGITTACGMARHRSSLPFFVCNEREREREYFKYEKKEKKKVKVDYVKGTYKYNAIPLNKLQLKEIARARENIEDYITKKIIRKDRTIFLFP